MEIVERGGALEIKCGTSLSASVTLTPLFDNIILESLPTFFSEIIEVIHGIKPLKGKVIAVGPGHYPKKYDHQEKHKRTRMWYSKRFQPSTIKVGEIVQLGGLNFGGYNFETFYWGKRLCLSCREADVIGIENADSSELDAGRTAKRA